nr:hypothetical protein [Tanacetum cinerariifolium]
MNLSLILILGCHRATLWAFAPKPEALGMNLISECSWPSKQLSKFLIISLKRSPSPTAAGGTGEATGVGMVRDAGQMGKELDDHSSDAGVRTDAASSLSEPGPSSSDSSLYESVPSASDSSPSVSVSTIGSEVPQYLFCEGRVSDGAEIKMMNRRQGGLRDSGEVESDGEVVECGEATLVSDALMGSDSSSVCGVAGV